MAEHQIFISYRRVGGEYLAGRLADKLRSLGYSVFYDVESMRAGKFNNQIYSAIESCQDVLVVLPEHALDRCQEKGDWVRIEIEYAISLRKNIIPVMVPGFTFPAVLPSGMDSIRDYEGVTANSEYFGAVMDRIQGMLKSEKPGCVNQSSGLTEGARFLSLGLYPQAWAALEKAMQTDLSNPDVYFYAAVAMLGGKRPFLTERTAIRKVEEYLNAAIAVGDRAVYHCFLAYVKLDFYHRKMLRTVPAYGQELEQAVTMGISAEEMEALFKLLRVDRPAEF